MKIQQNLKYLVLACMVAFCTMVHSMVPSIQIANKLYKPILVELFPYVHRSMQSVRPSKRSKAIVQAGAETRIEQPVGQSVYQLLVYDSESQQLLGKATIPVPFINIKKLKVLKKDKAIQIQIVFVDKKAMKFANEVLEKNNAAEKATDEKLQSQYLQMQREHPLWFTELNKLGAGYVDSFARFCLIIKYDQGESGNAMQDVSEFYNRSLIQMPGLTNTQVARLLALGTIAVNNAQLYRAELVYFMNYRLPEQVLLFPDKSCDIPQNDPRLYKIHLMPRDEELSLFFDGLLKFVLSTPEIRNKVNLIKVLAGDADQLGIARAPRIVLYIYSDKQADEGIQDSKAKAQFVLDRLYAQYKNMSGSGLVPEFNEKVTDLIFVTQGNRVDKLKGNAKNMFGPGYVYFKPGYEGSRTDFRLNNPVPQ